MKFTSHDRTLRQVLAGSFFFVPRYQRPYSWTRENVEELWDDAIKHNSGTDYFIGSMVVHPKPKSDDTVAVIDGQQRLTTLLMILCAVREAADRQGLSKLASGTHNVVERKDEEDNVRFVLHAETSKKFVDDHVLARGRGQLGEPEGLEQVAISEAFRRVTAFVDEQVRAIEDDVSLKPAQKAGRIEKKLDETRKKVLGLRVVYVEAAGQDDATTVFVTLNSRGKDLEPSDLVKAQLLQRLPKKGGLDAPMERWQKIVSKFDASQAKIDMTNFLLASFHSRYGRSTRKALDKDVRSRIKPSDADRYLSELTDDSELYRQIVEPSYRRWAKSQAASREALRFFVNFAIAQPRPLLLSILRGYDAKAVTYAQLRRVLRAVEDYHFTFNVLAGRSSSGGMSGFYVARALGLESASSRESRAAFVDKLIAELAGKRPTNDEFDAAFRALEFTDGVTAKKRQIQYILRRFHEHGSPRSVVDFEKFTIEHLAPQSGSVDGFGTLGNLIYVSENLNGALGNKPFAAKRPILREASEWIPPEILAAKKWDAQSISTRTKELAVEARTRIWAG